MVKGGYVSSFALLKIYRVILQFETETRSGIDVITIIGSTHVHACMDKTQTVSSVLIKDNNNTIVT